MATNLYFSQKVRSEQNLYEDIVIESLKMFGQDVYYLPRDIVNEDRIFGDDVPSRFNSSYKIEMYIENVEGYDGEGDIFTKFGIEIRDQATFVVARRRWEHTIKNYDNEITSVRPVEGDLIYLPLSKSLFQIMAVEHEQPFYQLSNLPIYKLRCELFEYNDEQLDTGVTEIDDIEAKYAYTYQLTLTDSAATNYIVGETVSQTLGSGVVISGEVTNWRSDTNVIDLAHVGADDGLFHTFATGISLVGGSSAASAKVTAVNEDNRISANEQNEDFAVIDFIDFTESNPFGDPS